MDSDNDNSIVSRDAEAKCSAVTSDNTGKLKKIGGSRNDTWNELLYDQIVGSSWIKRRSPEQEKQLMYATLGALIDIKPADPIEGMLVSQMIATQSAVMECYRLASLPNQQFICQQSYLKQAGQLSRTFATLAESLNRHRGKGHQQNVIVKYVTVEAGAQAIVGNVTGSEGINRSRKIEEQPYEQDTTADASVVTLRR